MPAYIGSKKVKELYYGGKKIKEAWYGSKKVYSSMPPYWVERTYYKKGDVVVVDVYGDLYKYYASSDHVASPYNKPFYGSGERKFWSTGYKIN